MLSLRDRANILAARAGINKTEAFRLLKQSDIIIYEAILSGQVVNIHKTGRIGFKIKRRKPVLHPQTREYMPEGKKLSPFFDAEKEITLKKQGLNKLLNNPATSQSVLSAFTH